MIRSMWCVAALAAACASLPAHAQDAELSKIREEIRQLKESYERRIETLERRLADAEARAGTEATAASPATGRPANETTFNPALSLILQGTAARSSQDRNTYRISGFAPSGGEVAPAGPLPCSSFGRAPPAR